LPERRILDARHAILDRAERNPNSHPVTNIARPESCVQDVTHA
jgi:hypothetical protein